METQPEQIDSYVAKKSFEDVSRSTCKNKWGVYLCVYMYICIYTYMHTYIFVCVGLHL